jgi:hypothetical protein
MSFQKYIEDQKLHPLDYYGTTIREVRGIKLYEDSCYNRSIISESSLSHILDLMNNKSFTIISAHRNLFNREENIIRNRKLRDIFNKRKMGVHQLIGHWRECQLKDKNGKPVKYELCPVDKLTDVLERSYLVIKPDDMSQQEFEALIKTAMTIDGETQDGVIIKNDDNTYSVMNDSGEKMKIGDNLKLNKIAQAYSQHIKKQDVPFVFEGMEIPNGSIMSYQLWNHKDYNFNYIVK